MATVLDIFRARRETRYFSVAQEEPSDIVARERLLDLAMGLNRRKKSSEILRRGHLPAEGLAFVARGLEGNVVGTVRLWNVHAGMSPNGMPLPALLLGPLAVDPAYEGMGMGSALMRKAIADARQLSHGAILLVGDAPYYTRFGFSADKTTTLVMPGPYERSRFLALELVEGWLIGASGVLSASGRKVWASPTNRAA